MDNGVVAECIDVFRNDDACRGVAEAAGTRAAYKVCLDKEGIEGVSGLFSVLVLGGGVRAEAEEEDGKRGKDGEDAEVFYERFPDGRE